MDNIFIYDVAVNGAFLNFLEAHIYFYISAFRFNSASVGGQEIYIVKYVLSFRILSVQSQLAAQLAVECCYCCIVAIGARCDVVSFDFCILLKVCIFRSCCCNHYTTVFVSERSLRCFCRSRCLTWGRADFRCRSCSCLGSWCCCSFRCCRSFRHFCCWCRCRLCCRCFCRSCCRRLCWLLCWCFCRLLCWCFRRLLCWRFCWLLGRCFRWLLSLFRSRSFLHLLRFFLFLSNRFRSLCCVCFCFAFRRSRRCRRVLNVGIVCCQNSQTGLLEYHRYRQKYGKKRFQP